MEHIMDHTAEQQYAGQANNAYAVTRPPSTLAIAPNPPLTDRILGLLSEIRCNLGDAASSQVDLAGRLFGPSPEPDTAATGKPTTDTETRITDALNDVLEVSRSIARRAGMFNNRI